MSNNKAGEPLDQHPWHRYKELQAFLPRNVNELVAQFNACYAKVRGKKGLITQELNEVANRFRELIRHFYIRRTEASEWNNERIMQFDTLQPKKIECPMTKEQRKAVNDKMVYHADAIGKKGRKDSKKKGKFLKVMMTMRVFVDFPALLDKELVSNMTRWVRQNNSFKSPADRNEFVFHLTWTQALNIGWWKAPSTCPFRRFASRIRKGNAKIFRMARDLAKQFHKSEEEGRKAVVLGFSPLCVYIAFQVS